MSSNVDEQGSLKQLKGVGPRVAERLGRLGIFSLQDVLFHLPYRYEDRTRLYPIGGLHHGMSAVIEGKIEYTDVAFSRRGRSRRMLLCYVADGTGGIVLRFFHFNKQQEARLVAGNYIRCFGEVRYGASSLEMVHPEYTVSSSREAHALQESLTPVYPTTEGVHQTLLRRITEQALQMAKTTRLIEEYLPEAVLCQHHMMSLQEAVHYVHRPPPDAELESLLAGEHPAQQRLAFEELLAHNLSLQLLRHKARQQGGYALKSNHHLLYRFSQSLPFKLTRAQQQVNQVILHDMEQAQPMMRLVQGDVGSGKTVVAAMACLKAVEAGYQAAIMAPTEILAEQHYQNFKNWLQPLDIKVAWLSGKLRAGVRSSMCEQLASGEAAVAVGTHALFQEDVQFKNLALVVIDEQHRFGVHQRLALREKGIRQGCMPHQLIMTATPIPRSLAMTAYADLDYSVIDELPPGRTPVQTVVLPESRREDVMQRVRNACKQGRQSYWVCTLVEESEALQCQAAEDTAQLLQQALPELRIGLVHGRMKPAQKEQVMSDFKRGGIHLLVATTVIEVGVDVPNASLMIIENAERLGLSQLHQLRGRVGRGADASHCVLLYRKGLSQQARSRLTVMRETSSGFDIARQDLKLRGPGEVLGTRQTGMMQFRVADIIRDEKNLPTVKQVAELIMAQYPQSVQPLIQRWLGMAQQYGSIG